MAIPYVELFWR